VAAERNLLIERERDQQERENRHQEANQRRQIKDRKARKLRIENATAAALVTPHAAATAAHFPPPSATRSNSIKIEVSQPPLPAAPCPALAAAAVGWANVAAMNSPMKAPTGSQLPLAHTPGSGSAARPARPALPPPVSKPREGSELKLGVCPAHNLPTPVHVFSHAQTPAKTPQVTPGNPILTTATTANAPVPVPPPLPPRPTRPVVLPDGRVTSSALNCAPAVVAWPTASPTSQTSNRSGATESLPLSSSQAGTHSMSTFEGPDPNALPAQAFDVGTSISALTQGKASASIPSFAGSFPRAPEARFGNEKHTTSIEKSKVGSEELLAKECIRALLQDSNLSLDELVDSLYKLSMKASSDGSDRSKSSALSQSNISTTFCTTKPIGGQPDIAADTNAVSVAHRASSDMVLNMWRPTGINSVCIQCVAGGLCMHTEQLFEAVSSLQPSKVNPCTNTIACASHSTISVKPSAPAFNTHSAVLAAAFATEKSQSLPSCSVSQLPNKIAAPALAVCSNLKRVQDDPQGRQVYRDFLERGNSLGTYLNIY
jgi:hypothetical protein